MLANGGGLQSSLVVARWPVCRPWRWLRDCGSCRRGFLTVSVGAGFWWSPRGALFSVALELLAVHWYVRLLWLYGGLTEGYSSVSELGSTVDACSATVGF